jgi:hypothetical protein
MQLEEHRVRELADVVEALLRPRALGSRNLSLQPPMRACRAVAIVPPTIAKRTIAAAATAIRCRAVNLPARYRNDPFLAIIGNRSRWRRMSSENCSTD